MPIYMDKHSAPTASAEGLAEAHERDLEVQEEFGVRFLTYWFDRERGSVFCLVDAPDARDPAEIRHRRDGGRRPRGRGRAR